MSSTPLVSGIIIFLNGENFLQEAVESVLGQTYANWELFLVDDGSADSSPDVARRFAERHPERIRYLHHPGRENRGPNASRNLGLHHAAGKYIALLDHDDIWLPNKLQDQVAILEAHPEAAMMYGRTKFWHGWTGKPEDRNRDGFTVLGVEPNTLVGPPRLLTLLLRDPATVAPTCSSLIRRDVALGVGGFDEDLRDQYEDLAFLTRVYLRAPVFVADGCWSCYRKHAASSTAKAVRTGEWNPGKLNRTREVFLNLVEQEITDAGVVDAELSEALDYELWPYRHATEVTPRQRFEEACWDAGLALLLGEDGRNTLLDVPGEVSDPTLDGQTVAEWMFEAVALLSGEGRGIWSRILPELRPRLLEYLAALERRTGSAGLAHAASWVLERLVEGNWWLHTSEGCTARRSFPHGHVDLVRVDLDRFGASAGWDIQLNRSNLAVRSGRRYAISFLARADTPRSIGVGVARAQAPWSNVGFYARSALTEEWARYDHEFVAGEDEENARMHFDLGDADAAVEIGAVALHDSSETGGREDRDDGIERLLAQLRASAGTSRPAAAPARRPAAVTTGSAAADQRALILMYHRVTEGLRDPWSLAVSPRNFEQHVAALRKYTEPVPLKTLVAALDSGRVPDRGVVVTFDDGYADNLLNARPVLDSHGVPATFFVASSYLEGRHEFWWDELERLVLNPPRLPRRLELRVDGTSHHWDVQETPESRELLHGALWDLLQPLPDEPRREVLKAIREWAGVADVVRSTHRQLSNQELRDLGSGGLFEIGGHTATHPCLPRLTAGQQRDEVRGGKAALESLLQSPVTSFAYPFGALTPETMSIVRDAGFTCSCSTIERSASRRSHRFRLPRFEVRDWDGDEFTRRLRRWFAGRG